jgi:CRISPR system Cascade subunit CasE
MIDSMPRPLVTQGFMSKVKVSLTLQNAAHFQTPYEQHRSLWRMFGEVPDGSFLFREIDPMSRRNKTLNFLVVSARRPMQVDGFNIDTREYAPRLQIGDRLEFSVRISVTSSITAAASGEQKRARGLKVDPIAAALHGNLSPEDRRRIRQMWLFPRVEDESHPEGPPLLVSNWLVPRFERHGVKINPGNTVVEAYEPAGLMGVKNNGDQQIRFSVAEISGEIEVIDPDSLRAAIFQGIGRGKGLGCGMLLIRRSKVGHASANVSVSSEDPEEELA